MDPEIVVNQVDLVSAYALSVIISALAQTYVHLVVNSISASPQCDRLSRESSMQVT